MEHNAARESLPAVLVGRPLGFAPAHQLHLVEPAQRLPPAVEM